VTVNFVVALRRSRCYLCIVGDGHKDLGQSKNNTAKKDKPAAEPIIVPIVLRMSDFDHKVYSLTGLTCFWFLMSLKYQLYSRSKNIPVVFIEYIRGLRSAHVND